MIFISIHTGVKSQLRSLFLLCFISFTLFGIVPQSQAQDKAAPALWKIETRQSTTYFLGSLHLLKAGTEWFDDRIAQAFESSGDLTLEVDQAQMNQKLIAFLIQQNGILPPREKLQDMLEPDVWQKFTSLATEMGLPIQNMQTMRPWFAATVLSVQFSQTQGYNQDLGVDNTLTRVAIEKGIPLFGLELASDQIKVFSELKQKIQIHMLEDTINSLSELDELYTDLLGAWLSGDEEDLERVLIEDMSNIPDLYDALMIKRNRNWIPKLRKLLGQPGIHFVVVGTAHLVGENSVLNMLKFRGFVAERVY